MHTHSVARSLIFLLLCASLVFATPAAFFAGRTHDNVRELPRSNAERLARHLPPAAPKHLYTPSRTRRDGGASPSPTISGYIAIYNSDGGVRRGYLAAAAATPSLVATTASAGVFTYTPSTASPVVLTTASGMNLALGSSSGVPNLLSANSANSARLLLTSTTTPAGSTPQRESTASARYLETTIFSIDSLTGGISTTFTNYDGSTPPIAVMQQGAYLYATGSASKYGAIASGSLQVTLQFVPILS
ncbi:hypothetical protein DFH06DRAFT_1129902 [Mycena polygramma]|nr:hypothetical protein DFH06DRAFT_1129902 [Mycena polygramma]